MWGLSYHVIVITYNSTNNFRLGCIIDLKVQFLYIWEAKVALLLDLVVQYACRIIKRNDQSQNSQFPWHPTKNWFTGIWVVYILFIFLWEIRTIETVIYCKWFTLSTKPNSSCYNFTDWFQTAISWMTSLKELTMQFSDVQHSDVKQSVDQQSCC